MKLVTAVIKPHKWEDVRVALEAAGVSGMTVSEVSVYRGAEDDLALVPKIRIEIAVPDAEVEAVVRAIETSAKTDRIGGGKIWVSPIDTVVRVRTDDAPR